jgi:hypothetical protein
MWNLCRGLSWNNPLAIPQGQTWQWCQCLAYLLKTFPGCGFSNGESLAIPWVLFELCRSTNPLLVLDSCAFDIPARRVSSPFSFSLGHLAFPFRGGSHKAFAAFIVGSGSRGSHAGRPPNPSRLFFPSYTAFPALLMIQPIPVFVNKFVPAPGPCLQHNNELLHQRKDCLGVTRME